MKSLRLSWNKFLNLVASRGAYYGAFLGLVPAALVLYGGYALLVEPGAMLNQDKQKTVEKLEMDVARGRAVEAGQVEFKQEFTRVVELFYESLPLLPKETELSSVIESVQEAARRYKVTLTGLFAVREAALSANADKLFEREIPCTVVGSYDDVMRFFLSVSQMTRILIVRDYAISSARERQSGARPAFVSASFSLLAFHAPPNSEFPNLPPDVRPALMPAETAQKSGASR